mmetsp:Transcript_19228/g.40091  ORF Transcript_19228/g.40091 Transcript_19228/m.40091 type:complete len:504 (-) Transcript_19228:133-1644(-)|eukprot:CAMPEP_0118653076 /NCGR_PEP_ID=MMETSP0785-20121206/11647_1 /TAXON_ID=91992 /ORGANISM="Bolidomonas pacifica, Strain CCMP 1866" /LENGTH=503 /DNA_ID=CAMNT_0006545613 /DNA_START=79 /DNA_END=1590 /DNA_ORIENTATION=-
MAPVLPHILLLVTDQFRLDAFTPGNTPNLHALSEQGTVFTSAYSSTPTCTPSRAGLLTGKSPWNHGMLGYAPDVSCTEYQTTLPQNMDDAGYTTYIAGKNHFGSLGNDTFVTQGYEHEQIYDGLGGGIPGDTNSDPDDYNIWFGEELPGVDPKATCNIDWNDWLACPYQFEEYLHPTAWTTSKAVEYVNQHDFDNDPMFLKVSYHRPHSPYDPPKRLFDKHLNSTIPERIINETAWDSIYYKGAASMMKSDWRGDPGTEAASNTRAGYLASVEFVDEGVGTLLSSLSDKGVLDDFLIVWATDHGDMNGDHYLWRKGFPWEASAHVPMVIKTPGDGGGVVKESDAIVELRDVTATIYDAAGILDVVKGKDGMMNGMSLLSVMRGEEEGVRDYLDLEHSVVYNETVHWNAIVGDDSVDGMRYKYIFNAYDGSEQLFNLENDANEGVDLVVWGSEDVRDGVVKRFRDIMVKQFEEEGRGETWVKDGVLQVRKAPQVFGSNYPCERR